MSDMNEMNGMNEVNEVTPEQETFDSGVMPEYDPNAVQNYAPQPEKKGLSIASLVLGICGILGCCSPIIGIICAILAIVFGVKGKQQNPNNTLAKAGLILGIIFLIVSILNWILGSVLLTALNLA